MILKAISSKRFFDRVIRTLYALSERWKMTKESSEEEVNAGAVELNAEEVILSESTACDSNLLLRFCLKTENNP